MQEYMDILFFERPISDLKRYAYRIAKELKQIDPSVVLGAVSIEPCEADTKTDVDFHYLNQNIHDIDAFLTEHHVKVIVFTNPRVPDMEMILHAHALHIKTVMIQEGVIFEGANINDVSASNVLASFKFLGKVREYLHILHRMCKYDGRRFFALGKELLKKRSHITNIVAHFFTPPLIADYVLTMGEYWQDYYENTVGYPKEAIKIMGDHDLDGFSVHSECEPALCYIATVLVEDGTRSRSEFNELITAMKNSIDKQTKLYIKLHPRSDESLYAPLKDHNVEFIRQGALPCVNVYIGHRSTLLARALYESDNLIIWKFPGEKADFFEQFASEVVSSESGLQAALKRLPPDGPRTNQKSALMEKVYWNNPHGAIRSAAEMIDRYRKEGAI